MLHYSHIRWHLLIISFYVLQLLFFLVFLHLHIVHALGIFVGSLVAHGVQNNTKILKDLSILEKISEKKMKFSREKSKKL